MSVKQCLTKQPPLLQRRGLASPTVRNVITCFRPPMKDVLGISPLVLLICFVWFSIHKIYQLENHLSSVKCQVASHCTHSTTVPRLPTQNHAFVLSSTRELVYSSTERLIGVFTCRCRPECIFIQQCGGHAQHPMDIYNTPRGGTCTLCKWMLAASASSIFSGFRLSPLASTTSS